MSTFINYSQLADKTASLTQSRVMIIGDVMFDHYLIGSVDRISPEAPVPVVRVTNETSRLGGAGNVAKNIADLGGSPLLIGFKGDDPDGDKLESLLEDAGVQSRIFTDSSRPTTRKTRIIAHNQQVVRVDHEDGREIPAERLETLFAYVEKRIAEYPVIILSDYGKGVLSQKFMDRLRSLAHKAGTRILIDPKTMNFHLYEKADLLTPNLKEASEGSGVPIRSIKDVPAAGKALFDKLKLKHLLITLGADGMAFFRTPEDILHLPTFAKKVYDVTGAGDTVIAVIGAGMAAGLDDLESCLLANYAAGIVVGQVGAATASAEEIHQTVLSMPKPEISNW